MNLFAKKWIDCQHCGAETQVSYNPYGSEPTHCPICGETVNPQ